MVAAWRELRIVNHTWFGKSLGAIAEGLLRVLSVAVGQSLVLDALLLTKLLGRYRVVEGIFV